MIKIVFSDRTRNYLSSQPVLLRTIATLTVKNPQVKTPFTTHTGYATKIKVPLEKTNQKRQFSKVSERQEIKIEP